MRSFWFWFIVALLAFFLFFLVTPPLPGQAADLRARRITGDDLLGPTWGTLTTIYDGHRLTVGSYPRDKEWGENTTGTVQGLVGAVDAPVTANFPNHVAGVAGYGRSAGTAAGVGVLGYGRLGANNAAFGGNFLAANDGHSGNMWGVEIDLNNVAAPLSANNVKGLAIVGGSDTTPTGAEAISIEPLGVFQSPRVKWRVGVAVQDGSTNLGLRLGTNRLSHYFLTDCSNTTPIVVTMLDDVNGINRHDLDTGMTVVVYGVGGNTACNGTFVVTKIDAETFSLNGSVGNGAYTAGTGQLNVANIAASAIHLGSRNGGGDLLTTVLTTDTFSNTIFHSGSGTLLALQAGGGGTNALLVQPDGSVSIPIGLNDLVILEDLRLKNDKKIFFKDSAGTAIPNVWFDGSNELNIGPQIAPVSGGDLIFWQNGVATLRLQPGAGGNHKLFPLTDATVDIGTSTNRIANFKGNQGVFYTIASSVAALSFQAGAGGGFATIEGAPSSGTNWLLKLPVDAGALNHPLVTDGAGVTSWSDTVTAKYFDIQSQVTPTAHWEWQVPTDTSAYFKDNAGGNFFTIQNSGAGTPYIAITAHVLPNADQTYTSGRSDLRWLEVWTKDMDASDTITAASYITPTSGVIINESGANLGVVKATLRVNIGAGATTTGNLGLFHASHSNLLTLQAGGSMTASKTYAWPSADGVSGDCMTTNGSGALSFGACGADTRAHAYHSANQTISNNTLTALTFNSESYDTAAIHDVSTNTSRFTVPTGQDGTYLCVGQARWQSAATGVRGLQIKKNGTFYWAYQSMHSSDTGDISTNGSVALPLAAGDYIEFIAFQTSGGDLDIIAGAGDTYGQITRIR